MILEKTKGKRKKTEKGEKGLVLKTEKTWRYREKLKSLRHLQANGNFAQAEGERSASERLRVGGGILGNLPLAPGADARAGSGFCGSRFFNRFFNRFDRFGSSALRSWGRWRGRQKSAVRRRRRCWKGALAGFAA